MAYGHGLITWTDLSSPDVAGAKAFYSALLDWDAEDIFHEDTLVYTMFRHAGKLAAGATGQSAEMVDRGVPPMWATYVNVADIHLIGERFAAGGGRLVVEPVNVMDSGWMAYGMDPTGAPIGFWQPGNHAGADAFDETGFLAWNELTTREVDGAIEFYTTILPWRVEQHDMGGFPSYMFMLGERPVAGIMTMDETWPEAVPSHWMTCFRVSDTQAAVATVEEIGGRVPVPPFDTPRGTVAVVNDPSGGTFSIVDPPPAL